LTDSSTAKGPAAAGDGGGDGSVRPRPGADPPPSSRHPGDLAHGRSSTPANSASVDCGTPGDTAGRDAAAAAAVPPDPAAAERRRRADRGGCGTSAGSRPAEAVAAPDRPSRRKDDLLRSSCVELDRANEAFRESSVCI